MIVNAEHDDNGGLIVTVCACGDETAHASCPPSNWWRTGNVMRWTPPDADTDVELPPWSWLVVQPEDKQVTSHG